MCFPGWFSNTLVFLFSTVCTLVFTQWPDTTLTTENRQQSDSYTPVTVHSHTLVIIYLSGQLTLVGGGETSSLWLLFRVWLHEVLTHMLSDWFTFSSCTENKQKTQNKTASSPLCTPPTDQQRKPALSKIITVWTNNILGKTQCPILVYRDPQCGQEMVVDQQQTTIVYFVGQRWLVLCGPLQVRDVSGHQFHLTSENLYCMWSMIIRLWSITGLDRFSIWV